MSRLVAISNPAAYFTFMSHHIGGIYVVVPYNFLWIISFFMLCKKGKVRLISNAHLPGVFPEKVLDQQVLKIAHYQVVEMITRDKKKGLWFTRYWEFSNVQQSR